MRSLYKSCLLLLTFTLLTPLRLHSQAGAIIWQDDFSSLNTSAWNIITGNGCEEDLCGWGNQELEYYQAGNVGIAEIEGEAGNYALVLQAKRESVEGFEFSSGKISSENNLAIKYGLIEMRIKAPDAETGLWPAAWLLGTNHRAVGWPACGEADLMEMGQKAEERSRQGFQGVSANNYVGANLLWYTEDACSEENLTCAASIAYDTDYNTPYVADNTITNRFLIYRMYWDNTSIRYTVEDMGVEYDLYAGEFPIGSGETAFQKPFYFILNLAVGGNFTDAATPMEVTAPLPAEMAIDYIRVRKWNGKGEVFQPGELLANAGVNLELDAGEEVTLNGSGSYGNIVAYSWTTGGLELAVGQEATINLPAGSHTITLTVRDAEGNTARDQIIVTVGGETLGEIIWEEQFDTFNSEIWNITEGNGCEEGLCGWGNQELEYYHPDNVYIEEIAGETGNHGLVLEAKQQTIGDNPFTSGKITTENKLAIKFGIVEVRMKIPDLESGLWPAAWLLGTNHRQVGWPYCGEIDMMEMGHSQAARIAEGAGSVSVNNFVGANLIWYTPLACSEGNPTCAASIASDPFYNAPYVSSTPMNDRFMIYRMYWDEKQIRFTAEDMGIEYDLYTNPFPIGANESAFQQPFYFILNLAVGGLFTGLLDETDITAPMPAKMVVDYVRVRKWNGKGEVAYADGAPLANAGSDQQVADDDRDGSEEIVLDARGSYGNIVSYEWYEGGAQIARDDSAVVRLLNGIHYITLKVRDEAGRVSEDELLIDVQEIIWEDEFDAFNPEYWNKDVGNGCPDLCGWGNQELQSYQEENVYTEEISEEPGNSALVLEAISETVATNNFTSGKTTTKDKVSLRYGIYEVRMKAPDVETGLWPAAWLLGIDQDELDWPRCGEIDMMEMGHRSSERTRQGFDGVSANNYVGANLIWYEEGACSGENPSCAASIAYDTYYNSPYTSASPITNRFMTYRMYWNEQHIRLVVLDNGIERDLYAAPFPISASSAAFREPFFLLLNMAVGGNFTDAATAGEVTAPLPAKMYIDYVRVKKWMGAGEVAFASGLLANAGPDAILIDKDGNGSEIVFLDASGSEDWDGTIVSYSWSLEGTEISTEVFPSVELDRGVHTIVLTITDNEENTATDEVIVTVTTGALGPLALAGNDTTLFDDDGDDLVSFTLDGSGSIPANSSITDWSWTKGAAGIASGETAVVTLGTGMHTILLTVTDEEGLQGTDEIIITVIDPDNQAPLADAGEDASYNDLDGDDLVLVTLDGSGSSDTDGNISFYTWFLGDNEIATGVNPSLQLSTGIYTITLLVTDNDGISGSDELTITVIDPDNIPPQADAGEDALLIDSDRNGLATFTLDASESSDTDGTIVTYSWLEEGEEIATGVSAEVNLSVGEHTLTLVLVDDDGASSSDEVFVKVHQEPIADAGEDQFILDEDGSGDEDVTLDASGSSDPFGSISYYSWIMEGDIEISSSQSFSFAFSVGTHIITLSVIDEDGAAAYDEVMIVVASTDNVIPTANAGEDIEVLDGDGNGREFVSLDGSGSNDSDGTILFYSWTENGTEIATGVSPLVEFTDGLHEVVLKVTDNEGASDIDTVSVYVSSSCLFEACTGDFAALVTSEDASNTTITFLPIREGTGDNLCLLYYGTSGTFPGTGISPYQEVQMNGISMGQTVHFYYTYSLPTGGEQNTLGCMGSFVVGECAEIPNIDPTANAGEDQEIEDSDKNGSETVTLDGSGSNDPDGKIAVYQWKKGSQVIGTGVSPEVNLGVGVHIITLTVIDELGAQDSDQVMVEVEAISGQTSFDDEPIKLYPTRTRDFIYISGGEEYINGVSVYNSLGQKILALESYPGALNFSEFSPGVYLLKIQVEERILTKKIIRMQ